LFEGEVFAIKNRSKFCRIVSTWVCTQHQSTISPVSFKHHFDNPNEEMMQKWASKLSKWYQDIIKKRFF
ncbi:MAG: hypothetical protein WCK09_18145, partial [Bacteroidota bacterium]